MSSDHHESARHRVVTATARAIAIWLVFAGVSQAQSGYSIVSWYDEFDGTSIDPARWALETGTGAEYGLVGWGNNELQNYTARTANARVVNGHLEITARREPFAGMDYTSARLTTRDRFSQTGGRFEIRAALPTGQGLWPAFWMLPSDSTYGGWASSGEIDVLEARGQDPTRIENTIHFGGAWPDNAASGRSYSLPGGGSIADFHTYAVEWDLTPSPALRWYVDDRLSWSTTDWWTTAAAYPAPFDRPFHLLVNLAVGGNYVGPPDASTLFPATMLVDYVRAYDTAPADIVIDVPAGSQSQFEAGLGRILVAESVTKTGTGSLVLDAANPFTGATRVSSGRLIVTHPEALQHSDVSVLPGGTLAAAGGSVVSAASLTLAGGTLDVDWLAVGGGIGIGRVTIQDGVLDGTPAVAVAAGGSLVLSADLGATIPIASLAVDEAAGAEVDLGLGRLTIAAGGTNSTALRNDIIAGRGDGNWNGSGITSSVAREAAGNSRAVGYTISPDGTATVAFAAPGDVDLDGVVDLIDLLAVLASGTYETLMPADWSQGDFNYDGATDLLDLLAILGSGTYDQGPYLPSPPFAAVDAGFTTAVREGGGNEPATMAVVSEPSTNMLGAGLTAFGLLGHLWRRRGRVPSVESSQTGLAVGPASAYTQA